MNENENKVHIDIQALYNQIVDKAIIELVSIMSPDEQTRKILKGMLTIHRKYGIDAATSMKIFAELAELTKEGNDEPTV